MELLPFLLHSSPWASLVCKLLSYHTVGMGMQGEERKNNLRMTQSQGFVQGKGKDQELSHHALHLMNNFKNCKRT